MLNPRLAGRYAKSLLDLAAERSQVDTVFNDMLFLQQVCKGSKDFVYVLKSPIVTADKKEKILNSICQGHISELSTAFINLLIRKGRETFLPEIVQAFIHQYKVSRGIHTVKLTTAVEVGDDIKNVITEKIKSLTSIEHVELHAVVNEEIIGGFILELDDQLIDASIAYDLNSVKQQFQRNDFVYKLR